MKITSAEQSVSQITYLDIFLYFSTLFLTLFSLAIIVENFMIPSLQKIAKKYNLSEQFTGYILAIGSCIPEFTTNLVAATKENGNYNIGIGNVTGSGSFAFTILFGIAAFFTNKEGLFLNKTLYYRDSFIYLFTLTIVTFFLIDNKINIFEASSLILLFPIYLYISTSKHQNEEKECVDSPFKIENNFSTNSYYSKTKELNAIRNEDSHLMRLNISVIDDTSISNHNTQFDFNSNHKTETCVSRDISKCEDENHEESLMLIKMEDKEVIKEKEENDDSNSYSNNLYSLFSKVKRLIVFLYSYLIPDPESYPKLCFLFILLIAYFHTRLVISIIESLSQLIKLSASFLGLTLLSWGGNVGDTINACVATKLKAVDLITTSILGSQVMNLQLCLGLPWLISIIKNYYTTKSIEINFGPRNPLKFLFPLFLVVLAAIFTMTLFNVNLNKKSGLCLIIIYILYLIYEITHNLG